MALIFSPAPSDGIEEFKLYQKKRILDERGGIFHMLRCDESSFEKFGEIYFSQVNPGVIKGWHRHETTVCNYLVLREKILLVLMDARPGSSTQGNGQALELDESSGLLAKIPAGVWYAFKGTGKAPSLIANCATLPHDPKESQKRPFDDPMFNWNWETRKFS